MVTFIVHWCEYSGGNIYSALVGLLPKTVTSLNGYEQDQNMQKISREVMAKMDVAV